MSERKILSVLVGTGTGPSECVRVEDKDLAEVTVFDDDSLQINDSRGEMIFYAPAGCWTNVGIRYADATPTPAE